MFLRAESTGEPAAAPRRLRIHARAKFASRGAVSELIGAIIVSRPLDGLVACRLIRAIGPSCTRLFPPRRECPPSASAALF
eukprot:CAMPEP_0184714388 /NCGR_PEP_ID=MMETSP0314-20130426/4529_1 /TAXON_ID=38298 /ORGANISM="Rhodella maculata, Strain CCMP 736" /LENGTH=80 /DNA_ID=CAMNT_0027177271 /DNA_START=305 /DNA_END=544 /DNA_ORIENTATION=-